MERTSASVIGPRSRALFDKTEGEHELRTRRESRARAESDEKEHAKLEGGLRTLHADLQHYAKNFPQNWARTHVDALNAAWDRVTSAEGAANELRLARQEKIFENDQRQTAINTAQDVLRQVTTSLTEVMAHQRDHASLEKARQDQLDLIQLKRQELREARLLIQGRLESSAKTITTWQKTLTEATVSLELTRGVLAHLRWYEVATRPGEVGPLDERRQTYERLLSAYEKNVNEEGLLDLAKQQQDLAHDARNAAKKHARDGATLEAMEKALESLADPSQVEDEAEDASERYRSASSSFAAANGNLSTFRDEIANAEKRCREVQSTPAQLGNNPPSTYVEAAAAATQLGERAASLATQLPALEETATLETERYHKSASIAGNTQRDLELIQGVGRSFSDVLAQVGPRPIPPTWSPPLKSVRSHLQDIEQTLVRLRGDDAVLTEKRGKFVEQLRKFATQSEFKDLPSGLATSFTNFLESELEDSASALSEQLDARLKALSSRIAEFEANRQLIIDYGMAAVEEALDVMKRAANNSRMPESIRTFGGREFLRMSWDMPDQMEERRGRMGDLIDDIANASELPTPTQFVQRAVRKLIRSPKVEVLFPDPDAPVEYLPIPQTAVKSGGERLTLAVVLFCLLARLRARTMGNRTTTPFILDNPVGTANLVRFVQLQRDVARAANVQLIYTTGLNDLEALRIFPKIARLRNARRSRRTGHRYLEVDPAPLVDAAHIGFGALDEDEE